MKPEEMLDYVQNKSWIQSNLEHYDDVRENEKH